MDSSRFDVVVWFTQTCDYKLKFYDKLYIGLCRRPELDRWRFDQCSRQTAEFSLRSETESLSLSCRPMWNRADRCFHVNTCHPMNTRLYVYIQLEKCQFVAQQLLTTVSNAPVSLRRNARAHITDRSSTRNYFHKRYSSTNIFYWRDFTDTFSNERNIFFVFYLSDIAMSMPFILFSFWLVLWK